MVGVLWFLHHAMEIPDLVGNILSLLKQSCSLHAMSFIFAGIWVSSSLLLMWMNCHTSSQDVPIFLYVSVKAVRFLGSWCLLVQYLYTINRHLRLEQVCTAPHGLGPLTHFSKQNDIRWSFRLSNAPALPLYVQNVALFLYSVTT